MEDALICVDLDDLPLYPLGKADCHRGVGRLHRAFSVFLLDSLGRVLLQQRSTNKHLWPGYWSNSCCSHPRWGEDLDEAVTRRVQEELGVIAETRRLYSFVYSSPFGDLGSERELCHVYRGQVSRESVRPDPLEIQAIRFVSPEQLDCELVEHAHKFTPWFKIEWPTVKSWL